MPAEPPPQPVSSQPVPDQPVPVSPQPDLSIIVVSYNTREMTLDCLRSIAAETRTPHEVILIDNASADGSAEAVAAAFPDIRLMAETDNHGFAAANNIAARQARGRYLLLLNPDTIVLDGAIDRLMAFAGDRPQARIWGGRTLYADRRLNPTNCWRAMSLWSLTMQVTGLSSLFRGSALLNPEGYGGWTRDRDRAVDIVSGCFFLIERDFWNALGGFDLDYVMYGEEADLCLRAAARGARPAVTHRAEIVHYVGAATTLRADRQIMVLKAKMTLIARHFPAWQRPLGRAMLRLWPATRAAATGLIARVTGRAAHRDRAAGWADVWTRRGEWRAGYPPRPAPEPASESASKSASEPKPA
ncbi:MAG: glycosyltransferase family 2 protein [Pseudomonadota bacterium]